MGKRVLAVSDDDQVVRTVRKILEKVGHAVTETFDYDGALSKLRLGPGAFEVMVTDLKLDVGHNGIQLALEARAIDPEVRIVLFTGMPMPDVYEAFRRAGVDRKFFSKIVYKGGSDITESLRKAVG